MDRGVLSAVAYMPVLYLLLYLGHCSPAECSRHLLYGTEMAKRVSDSARLLQKHINLH